MMTILYRFLTRRYVDRVTHSRRPRPSPERGAAVVEFSIVASLLMTLAVGTYEFGMAWNDAQLVTQAARSGARVAAQLGSDSQTDQRVLEAVEAALGNLEPGLVKVVVFDAGNADGSMASTCENANHPGRPGQCSVYHLAHITSFVQGSWDPAGRADELHNADYVGVYIEVDRPFLSGFLGPTDLRITDQTVMRVEPQFE
ncbi:MAG: pilus assembly protein [Acidimicrobiia bacterium]|nr:pilus assembly protein [Acidimicrobiia bacterium]